MTLQIPPRFLPFVKSVIAHGEFQNEQEVLDASLELMQRKHEFATKIRIGLEAAERGETLSEEEVFAPFEAKAMALGTTLDELANEP